MMARPVAGVLGVVLALTTTAHADESPQKQAAAEALFRDGRRLMSEGKLDEACPKFLAAQKLDSTTGTALNIGECFERAGKLATAWAGFDEARSLAKRAGDTARAAEAERRMKLLEERLSKLLVQAPPGGVPAGTEIRLDGQGLDPAVLGTAIPVDAGDHVLEVTRGGSTSKTTVHVDAPGTRAVQLPGTEQGAAAETSWGAQRIAGVTALGVGAASLVVGAIFGGLAMSKKAASNDGHCDAMDFCDTTGRSLRADAITAGNVSTGMFVAGGVLAAGGLVLFLTAPSGAAVRHESASVRLKVGAGNVSLTGRW